MRIKLFIHNNFVQEDHLKAGTFPLFKLSCYKKEEMRIEIESR